MIQKYRMMTETFLNWKELSISIVQGLASTAGVLFSYQWMVRNGGTEEETRGMVFSTLAFANIFLSLEDRSFTDSVFASFKNKNSLLLGIVLFTLLCLVTILFIAPMSNFFKVTRSSISEIGLAALVAAVSVLWLEVYKWRKKKK